MAGCLPKFVKSFSEGSSLMGLSISINRKGYESHKTIAHGAFQSWKQINMNLIKKSLKNRNFGKKDNPSPPTT